MEPYATLGGPPQPTITLYAGHCLDVLRTLPPASVHCIVTSPPYWGLRDYQTGTWEGGEVGCDHRPSTGRRGIASSTLQGGKGTTNHQQEGYAAVCGRCGARRVDQQIGLEPLHDCNGALTGGKCGACYICRMVEVFAEVWRVLRNEGTLWLSMGDSYARSPAKGGSGTYNGRNGYGEGYTGQKPIPPTLKEKDLCMMPARLALALQAAGWWLRQDIAWVKTAPMPESVRDRFTSRWEHVFLLAKSPHYFFDLEAVKERSVSDHPSGNGYQRPARLSYEGRGQATQWEVTPTRNKRNSWILNPEPYPGAHFATFPQKLVEPCVRAGCPPGGTVLDPFVGSGTVPLVALAHGRHAIGIDLSREYLHLATQRLTPALAQLSLFTRLALTALTEKA